MGFVIPSPLLRRAPLGPKASRSVLPPVRQPATGPALPLARLARRLPDAGGEVSVPGDPVAGPPRCAARRVASCRRRSRRRSTWSGSGSLRPHGTASASELPRQPFARRRHWPDRRSAIARCRSLAARRLVPVRRPSKLGRPAGPVSRGLFLVPSRPPVYLLQHPGGGLTGIGSWPGGSPVRRRSTLPKARGSSAPSAPALVIAPARPGSPCSRGSLTAGSDRDDLRTRCVPGRATSRRPGRSRLLASPLAARAVVPARPPKRPTGCSDLAGVQLPAPRTRCNL
jgi:hypothetical protein